jgi:hypothetical protein
LPCQWPGSAFCKARTLVISILPPQLHWKSKEEIHLSLMYPIFQKQSPKFYSYGLKSYIKASCTYLLLPFLWSQASNHEQPLFHKKFSWLLWILCPYVHMHHIYLALKQHPHLIFC